MHAAPALPKKYRNVLLVLASVVLATAAAGFVILGRGPDRAGSYSRPAEVDFPGIQLRPGSGGGSFTLAGRMRNKSPYATVTEVRLRVSMEDVSAGSGTASPVGSTSVVLRHEVPPRRSWSFAVPLSFGALFPARGRHEWSYSVVEIRTK